MTKHYIKYKASEKIDNLETTTNESVKFFKEGSVGVIIHSLGRALLI